MSDTELHRLVQQLLAKGQLPTEHANHLLAGYGHGEVCSVCGKSMPASAVVYEVSVGKEDFNFHLRCFEVWKSERECLEASGR